MDGRPWARFDDLDAGTALLCPPSSRILTAVRPDQVAGVLQEVQDATEEGSWAFGYVAYEAAAGLDPQLPGGSSTPGEPPPARGCPTCGRSGPLTGGEVVDHSPAGNS
jgi:para-aminobenzoate synthetase/4-amino-4-deoxychorismate lyase